ncbi:MAG: c-type cytochrome [Planctomycetota bacterium]
MKQYRNSACRPRRTATLILPLLAVLVAASCKQTEPGGTAMPAREHGAVLYGEHCAACHGDRGAGDGPAAIAVRVRPRDFRNEPFRYVSTMNGVPQHQDLVRTIRNGRRHGEMPGHPDLRDEEVARLVTYVLEIHRLSWAGRLEAEAEEGEEISADEIAEIAREKITAEEPVVVKAPPAGFRPDTKSGHRLYAQSCADCHGPTGRGDGLDRPKDARGRPIEVRDLTIGQFRGGMGKAELFWRIRCGVPGTPMASQALLSDEEIWQLVYYSLYLSGRNPYAASSPR